MSEDEGRNGEMTSVPGGMGSSPLLREWEVAGTNVLRCAMDGPTGAKALYYTWVGAKALRYACHGRERPPLRDLGVGGGRKSPQLCVGGLGHGEKLAVNF